MRGRAGEHYPDHWSILTESDQAQYRQLQLLMEPLSIRTSRDQSSVKFQIILGHIKQFAIRCNRDDWKRCLVCGIIWLDRAVAISTKQLSMLIGKCKSAINAGFQALGYIGSSISPAHAIAIIDVFSHLECNWNEIRQWTVRESCGHFCLGPVWPPSLPPLPEKSDKAEVQKKDQPSQEDLLTSSFELDWFGGPDYFDEVA
jgi:hypothetical protein